MRTGVKLLLEVKIYIFISKSCTFKLKLTIKITVVAVSDALNCSQYKERPTCKPGSVLSAWLTTAIIHLGYLSPGTSSDLPGDSADHT